MLIDDPGDSAAGRGGRWRLIADQVMGGVSRGRLVREDVAGRMAVRLLGRVSLDNNGGFLQMAIDLADDGRAIDAGGHTGIEIDVCGNGETYNAHLRTDGCTLPWQSYRCPFIADQRWVRLRLPFADFLPHRIGVPIDLGRLRRLGLVAIGRMFDVELACARVALFR